MNSWGKIAAILGIGALNLTHVFSSYIAFDELQAGIAMSIFSHTLLELIRSTPFLW
jgi:hypothetical protein